MTKRREVSLSEIDAGHTVRHEGKWRHCYGRYIDGKGKVGLLLDWPEWGRGEMRWCKLSRFDTIEVRT